MSRTMVSALTNIGMNISDGISVTAGHENETELESAVNVSEPGKEEFVYIFDRLTVRVALCLLYALVFIFCVLGNLAVVLVTTLHRRMRNTTQFFLGHLAMANLCVGVFCIYQHLNFYLVDTWIFGAFLCKMYHFTISLTQTASVLILVVTTIERYYVITYPFRSRYFLTMRRRRVTILLVWISSAMLSFHKFHYVTTMEHRLSPGVVETICYMDVTHFDHKIADIISFVLLFFLPLLAITILYTKAALFLRQQGRQWDVISQEKITLNILCPENVIPAVIQKSSDVSKRRYAIRRPAKTHKTIVIQCDKEELDRGSVQNSTNGMKQEEKQDSQVLSRDSSKSYQIGPENCSGRNLLRQTSSFCPSTTGRSSQRFRQERLRVMKTLMAVALCFAICNVPFYANKILQNYFDFYESDNEWLELIHPLTFLMMCLNCAINPFLHALLTRRFQQCLVEIVKCDRRRRAAASRFI